MKFVENILMAREEHATKTAETKQAPVGMTKYPAMARIAIDHSRALRIILSKTSPKRRLKIFQYSQADVFMHSFNIAILGILPRLRVIYLSKDYMILSLKDEQDFPISWQEAGGLARKSRIYDKSAQGKSIQHAVAIPVVVMPVIGVTASLLNLLCHWVAI